jgi:hypothetical protein
MRISIFKNIKSVAPIKDTKALSVLELIRDGKYKDAIAKIRIEPDKEIRNRLKAKLPYVTFAGTFETRANNYMKKSSGLACLDFDNVSDIESLKLNINSDKYTFASFLSPSGDGLKVLVKIPPVGNNEDYKDYYVKIIEHYSKYYDLDASTKDIARACYLSYDHDLYENADSDLFTEKFNKPLVKEKKTINIPITDKNEVAEKLDKWFTKRWTSVNRNVNLHAYARQMNAFGVDKSTCETYLFRYEQSDFKQLEIQKLIDSAYKYTSEFNTLHFEDKKKVNEIKSIVIAGEGVDKAKNKIKDIDFDKIKAEFNKHQEDLKSEDFWYFTDKGVIKLATYRFLMYLENNNIFKFFPDKDSDTYTFVKNDNNFISVFEESKIKDFVISDLRERAEIEAFEMMADNINYFSRKFLSMVKSIDVTFNRDNKDTSFIYYKNAVVKTTKNKIETLNYDQIDDLIWKNQVIDRNINLKDESDGVFKSFIWKVSGENRERYYTLKSVLGYLMHSHQNEAKPKSIIFNDEMISEDIPNGGSGKGLIHKGISHVKNIVIEDGKKFDPRGQFAYQKVNKDTQIFLLDDVPKHFNFESLFSIITEGMTVEKKGKDAYQIPFSESPKISITTNYTVNGSGASHERRVFEVEVANYFNESHTPQKEFGHLFFTDWDDSEWERFDNFMIRCIQYYLKNGLVESQKVNLKFRKLKNELGSEFIEFMETQKFDGNPINRKEFRDKFNKEYPNLAKFNTPQKFNKKVKDYCNYHKINFSEGKYNGSMMFYIGGLNYDLDDEKLEIWND